MRRIRVSLRNVYTTANKRALALMPIRTQRASPSDSTSSCASACGSSSAVAASSKRTPCFLKFATALSASHSISICIEYAYTCRQLQGGRLGKAGYGPNDEVERRGVAPTNNEAALSQSSTPTLAHRTYDLAIARTDC